MTCRATLSVEMKWTMHEIRCTLEPGHEHPWHEGSGGTRWRAREHDDNAGGLG